MASTIWWMLGYEDPHDGTQDVFADVSGFVACPTPEHHPEFRFVIKSPVPRPVADGAPVVVPTHEAFRANMMHHTATGLRHLEALPKPWKGFCVAGSSVIRSLTPIDQQTPTPLDSDWDIFVFGESEDERADAMEALVRAFPDDTFWLASGSVLYGWLPYNPRPFQIIKTNCKSARDVVIDFDSHSVGAYYDGLTVRVTPECRDALCNRLSIPRAGVKMQRKRVAKYLKAGFSVATPDEKTVQFFGNAGLDKLCDHAPEKTVFVNCTGASRETRYDAASAGKPKVNAWWAEPHDRDTLRGVFADMTHMVRTGY